MFGFGLRILGSDLIMSARETHHFQAEIQQLLNIVINSLYTDKEIFIRELISNAADALEKLRFLQTSGQPIHQPDLSLKIAVETDDKGSTIAITDTGIGMSHGELVENLGTIAHSGSRAFLEQLAGEKKPDASLIGQFGVGFYSAFMVAQKVTVFSRSFQADQPGWRWTSDGRGTYEIEPSPDLPRGTRVLLELKDQDKQFAQALSVERVIRHFSNFVQFPIELNGKALNTVRAIWTRNKNEIKEEEYNEFYQYVGHDHENPLYRLHFNADAPLAIQALLFVPSRNVENLGMSRTESEVNLYCRKILIEAKSKELFPQWLRFLKGVVDSEDLPLNISRETMQDTSLKQKLNKVLTGRFIKFLEEQTEKDPTAYEKFYEQFGRFLKEGLITDFTHAESLGKLLRYESSSLPRGTTTSLSEYVKRLAGGQSEIYYLVAPARDAAETSPYYEIFRARNYEVLFMYDPWDEFAMEHLREFEGKSLKSAEKAELKLEAPTTTETQEQLTDEQAEALAKWMKELLGERIGEVRVSKRLVDSPAVVFDAEHLTASMRRILQGARHAAGSAKHDLEINPRHPILCRLEKARHTQSALAAKVTEQLLDNARAAAGLLDDPRTMVKRLNELLAQVLVNP
jgi:TNF receptor-associated protein 1